MKKPQGASRYVTAIIKTHLASCGVPYEDLDKPLIGVVNSWNEIVPGHVPLRGIADLVKAGIRDAGGVPLEFGTIALCDGITQGHGGMRYPLPSRDLIADSIEAMVEGHGIFDGLVFVTACDKITPGMLMAAARLNLPCIFVTGGPMLSLLPESTKKEARRAFLSGEIGERELVERSLGFYSGPGVCPFLGTANTMLIACEALGMMLPGSALAPVNTAERSHLSYRAGQRAVGLVEESLTPSRVLTREAFENAIRVIVAAGGSLNSLLHISDTAREAGVEVTWDDFDRASREIPLLVPVTPNGPYSVVDLHLAGGVPALMKEIQGKLDLHALTVSGRGLEEVLREAHVRKREVIRPLDDPIRPEGGIAVLYGNLAPQGALVKQSAVKEDLLRFEGTAQVFDNEEECIRALERGEVREGSVVVIRYEGPRGGPGMREMHRVTEFSQRLKSCAVITDGRFSGATGGLSIGYIRPEAYDGGPIGVVQNGDKIKIDIPARKIELLLPSDTIVERLSSWSPREGMLASGFLESYRKNPRPRGCTERKRS